MNNKWELLRILAEKITSSHCFWLTWRKITIFFLLPSSWRSSTQWCTETTRGRLTWTNLQASITVQAQRMRTEWERARRGGPRTPSTPSWKTSTTDMASSLSGWWSTASSTTGKIVCLCVVMQCLVLSNAISLHILGFISWVYCQWIVGAHLYSSYTKLFPRSST